MNQITVSYSPTYILVFFFILILVGPMVWQSLDIRIYRKKNCKYYLYYPIHKKKKKKLISGIAIAIAVDVSDRSNWSIQGYWSFISQWRWLKVTGMNDIFILFILFYLILMVYIDDDGQAYLYFSNLWTFRLRSPKRRPDFL